ncbi:MAG: thrombospondin type 3 repeat-containing protein [Deltaproteobacteria bacterium]|nr:thrombospondin type 3 repeat-containing protein [Deltaproteobacteria bacterium]
MRKVVLLFLSLFLLLASCGGLENLDLKSDEVIESTPVVGSATPALPPSSEYQDVPLQAQTLTCSNVQMSTIGGAVTNSQSGVGISGASVSFGNSCPYGAMTTTNSAGSWSLTLPSNYTYPVSVSASGYNTLSTTRYVGPPASYVQNYSLVPNLTSASFGGESHPDGTTLNTSTNFTKQWTIYNNGTTVWQSNYYLRYVSGSMSTSTNNIPIGFSVNPGSGVVFSVSMRTPATSGTYRDDWQLKTSGGSTILVGGSSTVWASINVVLPQDSYEPDNTSLTAKPQSLNTTTTHSIVPTGDVDWIWFRLDTTLDVTIETSGASGYDTVLTLEQAAGGVITTNDDIGGGNYYSRITRRLNPDTYLVKVEDYGNDGQIPSYNLQLTVTAVNNPPNDCTLTSPSHGATGVSRSVTLDWACSDPDAGDSIVNYYIQLDDNSDFSSPLMNGWTNSTATAWQPSANGISLNYNTTYYWQVFGYDGEAQSRNWTRWAFTTESPPNNPPTALIISPSDGTVTTAPYVTIDGTCSDPNSNLSSVLVQNSTAGWNSSRSLSGGSASFNADVQLVPGWNSIGIICYDSNGATGSHFINVNRDVCPNGSLKDNIGDACNHNEDGDGRVDTADSCPFDPDDSIGDPCNHNDCGDFTARDSVGDACVHNDCPDFSPRDSWGDACVHNDCPDGSNQDAAGDPCDHGDCADPDTVGAPCNHSDCADLSLQDNVGDACNHSDCADGSPEDDTGDVCSHNDCPNLSLRDSYGDACNHDEDGDGITDGSDLCPFYTNDGINDVCNPDDNANFVFTGSPIQITVLKGTVNQTQQVTVTNTGTGPLYYNVSATTPTPWMTVVKNGGETDTLVRSTHLLAAGQTDQLQVTVNTADLQPAATVDTVLQVASSNDPSDGTATVPVTLSVQQPPYCDAICRSMANEKFGNKSPTVQNVSDPVNTATGNYAYHHTDLLLSGRGFGLNFARTYNSQDKYVGPLGFGWTHNYNIVATEWGDGSVQIRWGDGRSETYASNGDGTYQSPPGIFSSLIKNDDNGFTLATKDHSTLHFLANGRLDQVTDRKGNRLSLSYDLKNRLTQVTSSTGRSLVFAYASDEEFKIASVTDPAGRSVQFGYTGEDLTGFTDVRSGSYTYRYDPLHQMTEVTDPRGNRLVKNSYDDLSRVVAQEDGRVHRTQILYEVDGQPGRVLVTDPLGQMLRQVYDDSLRVVESQDPLGRPILYEYNVDSLRSGMTDRKGNRLSSTYDARGNLVSLTDPLGNVTRFEYNLETDDLVKTVEPTGHERNLEYDSEGNLTRVWEVVGEQTVESRYTYNEFGQATAFTDPEGQTTTFEYDNQGRLITTTDPTGGVTRQTYDGADRVATMTNPLGQTTTFAYNPDDQLNSVTSPDGSVVRYEYDTNGNPARVIDRNGNAIELRWNANDFMESIQDPLGNQTTFTYDALNRKTAVTDAENRTLRMTYDAAGNLSSMTDPSGRVSSFVYDQEGNVTSRTDSSGQTWSTRYDLLGRLTEATDPLGNRTVRQYDPVSGLLTQMTDAGGHVTQFSYDPLGRLTSLIDSMGQTTSFAYNRTGHLTRLTNAASHETTFTYDSSGRKTGQTNTLGEEEQYFYDLAGRLSRMVDGKGQTTLYDYNTAGHLSTIHLADGTTVDSTYDANGHRLTRTDSLGTARYTYDAAGRPTSFVDPRGFNLSYGYDRTGLLTQLTYPGDHTVQYVYNPSRQLTQVTDWLDQVTHYRYDTGGRLNEVTLPNGLTTTYGYDETSRLTDLTNDKADGSVLSSYHYTLDQLGRRTRVEKEEPLTPWISPEEVGATYNEENELLTLGPLNFDYDLNGNLISGGGISYSFDAKDQLSEVTSAAGTVVLGYDGDGNRTSLTQNGETTQFLVDDNRGLPDVVAEADSAGAIQNYYVYGLGLASQISADGSQVRFYQYDPLGSTVALSDPSGTVTDQYLYDELGRPNRKTGTTANPFQFVGKFGVQNDPTGLYSMRARYYDPVAGRFISRDPLGYSAGLNLYAYGKGDPVQNIDPSGNCLWDGCVVEAIAGACAVGGAFGFVGTGVADIATSIWNWEPSVSSWQTYAGNTIGGCAGGVTTLVTGGNVIVGGAVGGGVSDASTQTLNMATGVQEPFDYNYNSIGMSTVIGGGTGYLSSKIKIGDPKARGNYVEEGTLNNMGLEPNTNGRYKVYAPGQPGWYEPDSLNPQSLQGGTIDLYEIKSGASTLKSAPSGHDGKQLQILTTPGSYLSDTQLKTSYPGTIVPNYYVEYGKGVSPSFQSTVQAAGGTIRNAPFVPNEFYGSLVVNPSANRMVNNLWSTPDLGGGRASGAK